MDVEKLIEVMEFCKTIEFRRDCPECPGYGTLCHTHIATAVLAVRDHYESLLAADRSKVIAELYEWLELNEVEMYNPRRQNAVLSIDLQLKLDSMAGKFGAR